MVVFVIAESRNNIAETKIKEIIKEKLRITLKPDAIEISHRLSKKKTLNKIRPVIVKFRFRDDKWDVMKARRALKDSGISFAEDMCRELQDLQKDVANHAGVQAC